MRTCGYRKNCTGCGPRPRRVLVTAAVGWIIGSSSLIALLIYLSDSSYVLGLSLVVSYRVERASAIDYSRREKNSRRNARPVHISPIMYGTTALTIRVHLRLLYCITCVTRLATNLCDMRHRSPDPDFLMAPEPESLFYFVLFWGGLIPNLTSDR